MWSPQPDRPVARLDSPAELGDAITQADETSVRAEAAWLVQQELIA
jgi:hypothetical protein